MRTKLTCKEKRKTRSWKKSGRGRKLRKKPKQNNRSCLIDSKRWRRRWLLDPKPSKSPKSNRKS